MTSYQYKKHFSLTEARSNLPRLRTILRKIRKQNFQLEEAGFDAHRGDYLPGFHPGTLDEFPPQFRELLKLTQEIYDTGIELRSLEKGMIDFPALRSSGEEVLLCWKVDEDDIEFWHPLQGGFAGREHMDDF